MERTGRHMLFYGINYFGLVLTLIIALLNNSSCKKDDDPDEEDTIPTDTVVDYDPNIDDDYSSIADYANSDLWGSYNLHDPTIIKHEGTYYIYSTDVAYGNPTVCGIMFRKSEDLVQWSFLGWVFNGVPDIALEYMRSYQSTYEEQSIWAPYILKVGDQFRLYYSVPGNNNLKLACIGLATSTSPNGPWTDEGIVISCYPSDPYNAIDPAVIVDVDNGKHWFSYGSYSAGIFMVELNPATGKRQSEDDKGHLVAFRTNVHDAIEGAEYIYNTELKKYYMFVSYDWLEDNYNVRVGRADKPEGPYYDFNGNPMSGTGDNIPMITAKYKFKRHYGWQGFGHCGLLKDGDDYFYVSQARLVENKYIMDLHVRRMVWTPSGWPVISPERYVNVPQDTISSSDLIGEWEHIDLASPAAINTSISIEFEEDNTITGMDNSTWSFEDDVLTLKFNNEETVYSARVFNEWDWEKSRLTIAYSGLSATGQAGWGKKNTNLPE